MSDSSSPYIFVRYSDDQRRSLYRQILQLRYGPFEKHAKRATWEMIAEALDIHRSTIHEWRRLDDYKKSEVDYRQSMREEARTDASGMAQAALDQLYYLMLNAKSEFVQMECASRITKISQLDRETEEAQAEENTGLVEFQKLLLTRREELKKLKTMGVDPNNIVELEVKPGGFLPDEIIIQNEEIKRKLALAEKNLDEDKPGFS